MDINEIVHTLRKETEKQALSARTPSPNRTLEELGDFKFSNDKDDKGLKLEDLGYVKRSCKSCYGRGGIIRVDGGRRWHACQCLVRGYVRARRAHEAMLKAAPVDIK